MKILDTIIKLLQIVALASFLVTCSIAGWWMKNDNTYQSFYYNSRLNEIAGELALHNAKVQRQESNAPDTTR